MRDRQTEMKSGWDSERDNCRIYTKSKTGHIYREKISILSIATDVLLHWHTLFCWHVLLFLFHSFFPSFFLSFLLLLIYFYLFISFCFPLLTCVPAFIRWYFRCRLKIDKLFDIISTKRISYYISKNRSKQHIHLSRDMLTRISEYSKIPEKNRSGL